jgi:hypothetical protein
MNLKEIHSQFLKYSLFYLNENLSNYYTFVHLDASDDETTASINFIPCNPS